MWRGAEDEDDSDNPLEAAITNGVGQQCAAHAQATPMRSPSPGERIAMSQQTAPQPARWRSPFAPSLRLIRVSGIEIGINWTWLVVFGLIVWSLAAVVFPADEPGRTTGTYLLMGVVASLVFFTSLVLHELGHAFQARRDGVKIEGITLWLFGGVARFAGELPSAGAEFRIAIAGPLVSLALGVSFLLAAGVWPDPGIVREVLAWLGYINLVLLAFNLVPAIPLDGGRVLRSALWARTGSLRVATHRAARVGTVLAWMLIALGALEVASGAFQGIWLGVVGWFVFSAGRLEEERVDIESALATDTVGDLMTSAVVTLQAEWTLTDVAAALAGTARHTAYPVDQNGAVVGMLSFRALIDHPQPRWPWLSVTDCMTPLDAVPVFEPTTAAVEALEVLAGRGLGRGLVFDHARLVGILSITDLARALALSPRSPA